MRWEPIALLFVILAASVALHGAGRIVCGALFWIGLIGWSWWLKEERRRADRDRDDHDRPD